MRKLDAGFLELWNFLKQTRYKECDFKILAQRLRTFLRFTKVITEYPQLKEVEKYAEIINLCPLFIKNVEARIQTVKSSEYIIDDSTVANVTYLRNMRFLERVIVLFDLLKRNICKLTKLKKP